MTIPDSKTLDTRIELCERELRELRRLRRMVRAAERANEARGQRADDKVRLSNGGQRQ